LNAKLGDGYYTGWTAAHYAAHYGHAAALQFLHEAGANLNATNTRGETPAYVAVLQNQTEALDALAKAGADLQKAKTYYGQTPAHLAARKGDVDALRVLIQAGVNLDVRDSAGDTPADNAKGHEEALKLILEVTTARGLLPPPAISLKEAATRGDVAALAQHRQAGSDLNAKLSDVDGWTAAHYAAHYGHSAALQFLHEAGANLNATNTRGETPAYLAAEGRNTEALETLAKAGADLQKAETNQGRTPAHVAARNGDVDALRVLIQAGVNLKATDYDGCAPADDAVGDEEALKLILEAGGIISLKVAAMVGDVAALAQQRQAGSDLNANIGDRYHKGYTAAHYAAHYGQAAALQFLHEAGANLNVTENRGATPALLAAAQGKAAALEALAKAGADLQKPESEMGWTPAHVAAGNGHVDELRVLIQAGVDLNAKSIKGDTAADLAGRESEEALKLILEAGGKRSKE